MSGVIDILALLFFPGLRYYFHIGYHGTNYSGWQRHPNTVTVQSVLEDALHNVLKIPISVSGCGRTDAHVHASQFFFHLDIEKAWHFDLIFRLNKTLPDDIAIFDIIPMEGLPHARFDATDRSYDYFIHTYKDPFLSNFSSLYLINSYDTALMKRALKLLLKYNDYHAFCKLPTRNEHTICNITEADMFIDESGDKIRFHISANRFLGKMIRIIAGKLIDIGTGRVSIDEFEHHLINPKLPQIVKPAYPQGLYLSKIKYPYLDIPPRSTFCRMLAGEGNSWKMI